MSADTAPDPEPSEGPALEAWKDLAAKDLKGRSPDDLTRTRPEGIDVSRDGRTLWVGDLEGARVQAFDTTSWRYGHADL